MAKGSAEMEANNKTGLMIRVGSEMPTYLYARWEDYPEGRYWQVAQYDDGECSDWVQLDPGVVPEAMSDALVEFVERFGRRARPIDEVRA